MPRATRRLSRRTLVLASILLGWLWGGVGCSPPVSVPPANPPVAAAPSAKPTAEPAVDPATPAPSSGLSFVPTSAPQERPWNRLVRETSPYLRAHARNPVDWFPWGDEALALAREKNRPIFLSVGYSSCHWCHVMERESFCDEEIAAFLNEHFVCIKVDREERPDIDAIYMAAVQIITRHGGWPMSVFLLPDGRPFFGGTYFPPRDGERGAATGFLTLLKKIHEAWIERADDLKSDAGRLTDLVQAALDRRRPPRLDPLTRDLVHAVQDALAEEFDERYGGFGFDAAQPKRPKFPESSNLYFLVHRAGRASLDEPRRTAARKMLVGTLDGMLTGGIHDHLGGGFHRYSVDRYWEIPHFEKMLYDNGQLATVFAETYHLLRAAGTDRPDYRSAVVALADFVLGEMTDPAGGFYAALDADSEDEEGAYYRWERDAVRAVLAADYDLFASLYGFDGEPNFEGFFVPRLAQPLGTLAAARKTTWEELETQLVPLRQKLFAERGKRPRPLTDTKVLTSWNGLMIRGLADTGRCLEAPSYVDAARRAARFVLDKLRTPDDRLLRTYGEGTAKLNGYLDDYVFLVDGLLALHAATGERDWLTAAERLTDKQLALFWDERHGGFYFTSEDHESLLSRVRKVADEAVPSGNSVAAENLLRLAALLDRPDYSAKARRTLESLASVIEAAPGAAPRAAVALERLLEP